MKPTKSKLLPLNEASRWWLNKDGNNNVGFYYFSKGDCWIVRPEKPTEKPTKKPTAFSKKLEEKQISPSAQLIIILLAGALGISLGLNFTTLLLNF